MPPPTAERKAQTSRAPWDSDHGLSAGLKWLATYMVKPDGTVTVTVPEEELKLPEDQGVLLLQSVRELLINSSKHAGTEKAAVAMEQNNDMLRIRVHDEGAGFDPATLEGDEGSSGAVSPSLDSSASGSGCGHWGPAGDRLGSCKETTATLMLPLGTNDNRTREVL